ncbi:MAG: protein FdrA, partial [Actinomycetota bacterium]|nr:protein FdrA [Actinomycetota bacterium]
MDRVVIHPDTYLDSVLLLAATRAMSALDGVEWATAAMATPANVATLREQGFGDDALNGATANDLVLAVLSDDSDTVDSALAAGDDALFSDRPAGAGTGPGSREQAPAPSIDEARRRLPEGNVAIVSVPGPFAALEAHRALGAGLHVLLFSDNVPLDEEIELKQRAVHLGLLVMGPGAGTAVLGGCGLGFANVVAPGRVGVVAAAGTGAQEVMSLIDQWGDGCSQVIGVGGRDLSAAVGGLMAGAAVEALDADDATDVILLVSKPPDADVARRVMARASATPVVAALIGLDTVDGINGIRSDTVITSTLEAGAAAAVAALGGSTPDDMAALRAEIDAAGERLGDDQTLVHGLFSGGTLCYEALGLLAVVLGQPVYSNTPLDESHGLPAPDGTHVCLDLGEEEFTQGRPHPMIDPEARIERLREVGGRSDVAVVLLDVVLGYGAHDDPAGTLAPVCREIIAQGGPAIVTYVLGTDGDPQGLDDQRRRLRDAGCVVAPTGARA